MKRKFLTFALLALGVLGIYAQQLSPMPLNPKVRHGVLPNGMNYYLLHNEEPKDRANFYIAQKVGSTLETPQQLGLAHFLEHMAFNGTKHYPGKAMLEYLQSKGLRFGADINAYTSFDETVYNIDNVISTDKALMDSVLLILHDWSCEIALENEEIDAERGVIQEEWRMRNDANTRYYTALLPKAYAEYQYQQMPIGKMEIVMNFPYQDLKDYYKKWYRPDQQGIIIVGDFDVDEMEKKVKDLFTPIVMPENAAERTYPTVSDNKEPIYFAMADPESQYSLTTISFKREKTPFEYRNTVEAFLSDHLLQNIVSSMINQRLSELSQKPDCPFAYAGTNFGDYLVSKTKGAFSLMTLAKGNNMQEAVAAALAEVARSCQTGFTDSELARTKESLLANYEKMYNERDKTKNGALAKELIRTFVDNEPAPGIEAEYEIVKQLMNAVNVQICNQFAKTIISPENQLISVQMPEKEGYSLPSQEDMVNTVENAINQKYEAYVDEVITDPLISKLPKNGSIKKTVNNNELGTVEFTLSNGAKVVVKSTDYAGDQILFTATKKGGKNSYDPTPQNLDNLQMMDVAAEVSKHGKFDATMLEKYLAGKNVSVGYSIANSQTSLQGQSTVKDLPTMMELIYSTFTDLQPDPERYTAYASQIKSMISNQDKNPQKIFSDSLMLDWYNHNPIFASLKAENVDRANYEECLANVKKSMANAAEYTFFFVGNVDLKTLKPLLNRYIASLPSDKKAVPAETRPIEMTKGVVTDMFTVKSQTPTVMAAGIYSGNNIEYNIENATKIDILGDILSNVYVRTLREEEGGVYSPYAGGMINHLTGTWCVIYQVQTNAEKMITILSRANKEFENLLKNGATADDFNKVREAAAKQHEISIKNNGYWLRNLETNYIWNHNMITGSGEAITNLTLDNFNNFLKGLYDGKNRLEVIMLGK